MTRKVQAIETETAELALVVIEPTTALAVLTDTAKFESFYERIKAQTDAHVPDVSTERGRQEIKSLAFKVVKTKTAIDAEGKRLTEEWRDKVKLVDDSRREIRERLDALRDEVRAPLTKWEADEERRIAIVEDQIKQLRAHMSVSFDETAEDVAKRLANVANASFDQDLFQGHADIAYALQRQCVDILEIAHNRLVREEADRVELERLRAAEIERVERLAIENAHAQELADIMSGVRQIGEYVRAESDRVVAEAAQRAADIKVAAEAAESAARDKAEREAQEARDAQDKAHREALAAAQRRADDAEAETQRQLQQVLADALAKAAEEKRLADEQTARDKDHANRSKVMAAAKEALMLVGVSEATAKSIVRAIVAEEIPNVRLTF